MDKLEASRILRHIIHTVYLDHFGGVKNEKIDRIEYADEAATVILKDGRYITITVTAHN